MRYVLGIDQGGSKTQAALADEWGNILAVGRSRGANWPVSGMENAIGAVMDACGKALQTAGVRMDEVSALASAMTGADWPHEYEVLHGELFKATGISNIKVYNDCIGAFRAGASRPWGAVLCAGSGLNAAAINPEGGEFIFGYYVRPEDQGGGALARQAIQAVASAYAGLEGPTALTGEALGYFNTAGVDDLIMQYTNGGIPDSALFGFVPVLFRVAGEGDAAAASIIERFGRSSAGYALAGLERFGLLDTDAEVVLSGGIFKADSGLLKKPLCAAILSRAPKAIIVDAKYEPVVGAVKLALEELLGKAVDEPMNRNIGESCKKASLLRLNGK